MLLLEGCCFKKMAMSVNCVEEISAVWKKSMCRHFGAASCSKWQQLYTDVVCIHLGLKPSLLLDYLKPDAKKLQLLLQEVRVGNVCPLSPDLIILKIGEDILLVKTQSVAIPHNGRDSKSSLHLACCYVNITKGIKLPSLLSDELVVDIEQEFEHWWRGFNHRIHQSRAEDVGISILDSGYCLPNICSLFGKLLGYPVVYWFDPEQGYSLEMVNLLCHTVTVCSLSSTGIKPATLYSLEKQHVLYSFTAPECVLPALQGAIDSWFCELQMKAESAGLLVEMKTRCVCLPTVVL